MPVAMNLSLKRLSYRLLWLTDEENCICSLIKTILSYIVFGTTQGNNQNVFIAKRLLFWRCCCFQKMSMIVIKFAKRIS